MGLTMMRALSTVARLPKVGLLKTSFLDVFCFYAEFLPEEELGEQPLFTIYVSEDKLHAYFQLNTTDHHQGPRAAASLKEVVAALEQQSIISNLNIAAIQMELDTPTYEPILVASGQRPTTGRDARIELYFANLASEQFYEVDGVVDYRNHLHIPFARQGDIIARKIPMVKGNPGYDVYGSVILPHPSKDIQVVAKTNVTLKPNGELVALAAGRPRVTGDEVQCFDITAAYTVAGDVNLETGNIAYPGDIIVYGNVADYTAIESLGNVYIYGSVYNATITAAGHISIRGNIIGSRINAGYFGAHFERLHSIAKSLCTQLDQLHLAATQMIALVTTRKMTAPFDQIISLLLKQKYNGIPAAMRQLLQAIDGLRQLRTAENDALRAELAYFLHDAYADQTVTPAHLKRIHTLLEHSCREIARMLEVDVQLILNQCHNAELRSKGNITIKREGVLISNLQAAGNIIFENPQSLCRGSTLDAAKHIVAQFVGGNSASSVLKAGSSVTVRKMYAGKICIKGYCIDIDEAVESTRYDVAQLSRLGSQQVRKC